jgi:transposase
MVALKYNPLMNVFAQRLKADGLTPKAVIVACMHKLLRHIYGVLKSRNAFDAHFLKNRLDFQNGI